MPVISRPTSDALSVRNLSVVPLTGSYVFRVRTARAAAGAAVAESEASALGAGADCEPYVVVMRVCRRTRQSVALAVRRATYGLGARDEEEQALLDVGLSVFEVGHLARLTLRRRSAAASPKAASNQQEKSYRSQVLDRPGFQIMNLPTNFVIRRLQLFTSKMETLALCGVGLS